jgi:hypothetical protein
VRKIDKVKAQIIRNKRERKRLRRKRKNRVYQPRYNIKEGKSFTVQRKIDTKVLESYKNPLHTYFEDTDLKGSGKNYIRLEPTFSIIENTDDTITQLGIIQSSIHHNMGETMTLDFSKCIKTDLHTLFVLRILVHEYRNRQVSLQRRIFSQSVLTNYSIIRSSKEDVNKKLLAGGLISSLTIKIDQMMPISTTGIHTGEKTQYHFAENKKGVTATRIARYVNDGLKKYSFSLTEADQNEMESLISEVLNNAEDHGVEKTWYATATLFEENRMANVAGQQIIGELSITIINFGPSYYEGFEQTKVENQIMYNEINQLYTNASSCSGGGAFTKEDYFTLYALQDGMSRLKFEKESRGTGTMKFINSFFRIGDYENLQKSYLPSLHILTGSTLLKCDNKFKPFKVEDDFCLSLNPQNDLSIPPQKSHLKSLSKKFPGTVLAVKVYLNEDHLKEKI